jgi:hypothetical protein
MPTQTKYFHRSYSTLGTTAVLTYLFKASLSTAQNSDFSLNTHNDSNSRRIMSLLLILI